MNFFQDGNTALHLAASSGHAVLVEKLINCGAQKDITNKVSSCMVCTVLLQLFVLKHSLYSNLHACTHACCRPIIILFTINIISP